MSHKYGAISSIGVRHSFQVRLTHNTYQLDSHTVLCNSLCYSCESYGHSGLPDTQDGHTFHLWMVLAQEERDEDGGVMWWRRLSDWRRTGRNGVRDRQNWKKRRKFSWAWIPVTQIGSSSLWSGVYLTPSPPWQRCFSSHSNDVISVLWDMMRCSLVGRCPCFRGTFTWRHWIPDVGTSLPDSFAAVLLVHHCGVELLITTVWWLAYRRLWVQILAQRLVMLTSLSWRLLSFVKWCYLACSASIFRIEESVVYLDGGCGMSLQNNATHPPQYSVTCPTKH